MRQGGYALLLGLVALIGLSGFVAIDFTRDAKARAERERYQHNERALREAKRALLMYAYNYPNIVPGRGPGRLPCPDADNDGQPEVFPNCVNGGNAIVGRFPWAANGMNLYDIRDASGQRLWYAVSSAFDFADDDAINAGTGGTITIHDQANRVLYDNSIGGIAAVIIAPGPAIDRAGVPQNRTILNGDDPEGVVPDTDPGIINAANYLDTFGGRDNIDFDNTIPSADGFIIGPVRTPNGDVRINDQMILITAEEITRVAQRAALETYRDRIAAWQQTIWGGAVANYRYPWLNDYDDVAALGIDVYAVDPVNGNSAGRVPYLNYFEDHDSHTAIMDLFVDYDLDYGFNDTADPFDQTYLVAFDTRFGARQLDLAGVDVAFDQQVFGGGADNRTDNLGTMIVADGGGAVVNAGATVTERLFFWDGCCGVNPQDGWEVCPVNAGDETDCARNPAGTAFVPFTDWDDHADIRIRVVDLQLNLDAEFQLGLDYSAPPTWDPPTPPFAGVSARRQADLDPNSVTDIGVDIDNSVAANIEFINVNVAMCEQDDNVGSSFNAFYLGNADAGSSVCAITLTTAIAVNQFDITGDYYPELPVWVRLNDWNDSILLAYAPDFAPGGGADCGTTPPCLTVNNDFDGSSATNFALLVGANDQPANAGQLLAIFDLPNDVPGEDNGAGNPDTIYDANPTDGNDTLLVINEN